MDEKPDQIIEHIEARRDELGRNLSELETKVRRTTDWHTYYDKNPMMILGAALGGGLLIGAAVARGGSSRSRTKGIRKSSYKPSTGTSGMSGRSGSSAGSSYYTPAETSSSSFAGLGSSTGAASHQTPSSSSATGSSSESGTSTVGNLTSKLQTLAGGQIHQVNEAFDHIRGALIAFGISKVKEFLSQSVPGLEQHLGHLGGNSHKDQQPKPGSSTSYSTGSSAPTSGVGGNSGASDYRSGAQNYSGGSSSQGTGSTGQTGNSSQPGNSGPSATTTNTGRVSEADEYAGAGTRGSTPRPTP